MERLPGGPPNSILIEFQEKALQNLGNPNDDFLKWTKEQDADKEAKLAELERKARNYHEYRPPPRHRGYDRERE